MSRLSTRSFLCACLESPFESPFETLLAGSYYTGRGELHQWFDPPAFRCLASEINHELASLSLEPDRDILLGWCHWRWEGG